MDPKLRFGQGNAKLSSHITTFSLPAGYSCPFALTCLSKSNRETGKITDGKQTEVRCYAASMECRRPSVRQNRWHNFQALRACKDKAAMISLMLDSLSPWAGYVRLHDGGDYFNQDYFDAWLAVAVLRPKTTFYWYTKSLRYWVRRIREVGRGYKPGRIPNVIPTASWGGREDHLIKRHRLRSAAIVYSTSEAEERGLTIDHDDGFAAKHGPDFALLIHGMQPAGSKAAKATQTLRSNGWFGYGVSRIPLVVR